MGADNEDNLIQGLNSYRQSLSLSALARNERADCLADEIADQLEDEHCTPITSSSNIVPTTPSQLSDYPKLLKKCKIDMNSTADGVIMPVCVPKLIPTLVLTNYTRSQYAKHLNSSKFTGAGIGSEDDWMVLILTTNTPSGDFASSAISWLSNIAFVHLFVPLLLGFSMLLVS